MNFFDRLLNYDSLPLFLRKTIELMGDYPFVVLGVIATFLFILARNFRIYPNPPMWLVATIPLLLSGLVVFYPNLFVMTLLIDVGIVLVVLVDLCLLPRGTHITTSREMTKTVSLGKDHVVDLGLVNHSTRHIRAWIRDDLPQWFEPNISEFDKVLPPRAKMSLRYHFRAKHRGKFHMEHIYLKFHSLIGFWKRFVQQDVANEVHVYPDMKQLGEYALLARKNKLSLMGLRRTRRIGQDNEFERLRDYTTDDNFKHIDWRTTARRNKLTVRDFQANQSQRIIFLLDCGRMMTNEASGLNLLDHSLNAILMLSYIALEKGDSVGLICFSDKVHTYVPPRGGMGQMNQLLHAMFNRDPDYVESRYDLAFLYLATHCLRRSLVIMVSNVIDEVNSMQIQQYLTSLVGRHLPMAVLLRDHSLFDSADRPPSDIAEVYNSAVAAEILTWRHQVLVDLEHKGVLSLDVFPEEITAPLINRYLEIKARHLL